MDAGTRFDGNLRRMSSAPDLSGLDPAQVSKPVVPPKLDPLIWPTVGVGVGKDDKAPFFELERKNTAILQQYSFGALLVVFGFLELILARGFAQFFGFALIVIGPLLIFGAGKVNKFRPGLTLTPAGASYHDGYGAITVPWDEVDSIETHTPPNKFLQRLTLGRNGQELMGIHANPDSVKRTGRATQQTAVQAKLVGTAELTLLPWTLDGGQSLVVALVAWCSVPANRELIGTVRGRRAFWATLNK